MTLSAEPLESLDGRDVQRTRVMVPMRDGVRLATDVYWRGSERLDEVEPLPVLLERSPYDVRAQRFSDGVHADGRPVTPESGASFYVEHGWVVVRQDCRGRGGSEGRFVKYVNEAADGVDTHAWLAEQPWCDGTVVTQGVSYSAHTQAAAASLAVQPLAAMILDSGGFSSAFDAGGRFGGAFELKQAVWSFHRAQQVADQDGAHDLGAWFATMPWRAGFSPLSFSPEYESFLFEQWEHEDLDEFWTQPGLYARGYYDRFPAVPVLSISSWYDPYVLTAVENHRALSARHPGSSLVMGPWTHGARSRSWAGDVDLGPEAVLDGQLGADYLSFKQRWITDALAGRAGDVTYFLMGGGSGRRTASGRLDHGGSWRRSASWPPASSRQLTLYLHDDQALSTRPGRVASISYDFDPADPVPTRGGGITSGEPLMHGGAFDQVYEVRTERGVALLPLSSRPDVVSFQTAPLVDPVVVAGTVLLELDFSSSAPDTDLAVTLVDVYPPSADYPQGYAMNVTDGMLRLRHRDDPSHPVLMDAGQVYQVRVVLPDTANHFAAGHRLRVDVTSSNFPRCDVNPNTGGAVFGARTRQVARNTLHLGRSALHVDVLPLARRD